MSEETIMEKLARLKKHAWHCTSKELRGAGIETEWKCDFCGETFLMYDNIPIPGIDTPDESTCPGSGGSDE